jgi:hypothetical protein
MSEYTEVEQPFLHQLQGLGWRIIDQGAEIPSDPTKSQRLNFRQRPQSDGMAEGMNQQLEQARGRQCRGQGQRNGTRDPQTLHRASR